YGSFAAEMLGSQRYPKVKAVTGANIIQPYDVAAWSLPLMMGVEVESVRLGASERAALRPARDDDWPSGGLAGGGAGGVYALSHQATAASRLAQALLRAKAAVSVAREAFSAGGTGFAAGTFLVEGGTDLAGLAQRHHLMLVRLAERPRVQTFKLRDV